MSRLNCVLAVMWCLFKAGRWDAPWSRFVAIPRGNHKRLIWRLLHECSSFIVLLNELRKRDKMRGLPSILSLFRNEFNKFNNTGARMLDSIYYMTLSIL